AGDEQAALAGLPYPQADARVVALQGVGEGVELVGRPERGPAVVERLEHALDGGPLERGAVDGVLRVGGDARSGLVEHTGAPRALGRPTSGRADEDSPAERQRADRDDRDAG